MNDYPVVEPSAPSPRNEMLRDVAIVLGCNPRASRATGWKSVRDCSSPLTRTCIISVPSGVIIAACNGEEFIRRANGSSSGIEVSFPDPPLSGVKRTCRLRCEHGVSENWYHGRQWILRDDMLRQFLVGGGVSVINIAIHALVMTILVSVARAIRAENKPHPSLFLMAVMIPTVSVLMVTHAIEVIVWALAYWIVDAVPPGANLVYFAFVNYATLGYGDVVPLKRWLLLGPITAMNGFLLLGWSTAVIFEVLRRALARTGFASSKRFVVFFLVFLAG